MLIGLLPAAGADAAPPRKPVAPRPPYQRPPPKPPEKSAFADVEAEAVCVVKANRLDITASLVRGSGPGPGPYVWGVTFYLEQKLAGKPDFQPVGNALPAPGFPSLLLPIEEEDDIVDVAVQSFPNFCNAISPAAEWVRGAVIVEIANAGPARPEGPFHGAQCKSVRNPCR